MKCKLVDVFAKEKLSGNSLTIFYDHTSLTDQMMLSLTREMRQFESIFVSKVLSNSSVRARIFTVEEELDFAGHPVIGLAAHLHEEYGGENPGEWQIQLNTKTVTIKTEKTENYYRASMDQGSPEYIGALSPQEADEILPVLNLKPDDMARFPMEVVSTGLPYLIVPVTDGIENTKILTPDFENILKRYKAKFIYILDIINFEGRTWNNDGSIEDIATGSAAGPAAAYLCKHALAQENSTIHLSQGRFVQRPSTIEVFVRTENGTVTNVLVSGEVIKVADISFCS